MQNYDDLDIEGRNPSHLSEEEREKEEFDRRRLMRSSVTSEDGILRPVYSKTDEGDIWCHICNISLFGAQKLLRHNISSLHRIKLDEWPYPVSLWSKKEPIKSNLQGQINISDSLAPGEPAPPGMEDQVNRITSIQVSLDRHQSSPLVGLEYLLEIIDNDSPEPSYKCVLCEKRGDPRTVMAHITSYNHRMTYLHRHFPTISRAITDLPRTANYKRGANEISILVAKKIQEKFGRLQPQLVDKGQYEKNKTQYTKNCVQDYHFRETPELTFMEVYDVRWVTNFEEKMAEITSESNKKDNAANENKHEEKTTKKEESKLDKAFPKKIEPDTTKTEMKIRILTKDKINRKSEKDDKKIRPSDDTKSLSSLSSISSSPSPTRSRSRSCSRSRRRQSSRDRLRHRSNKIRNPRSRSRSRSTEPLRERDKWDKFREQIRRAEETLDRSLKFHEKNPEKHPSYPDEWKKFWNRRYKELQADGQDPSKHDFKPEWIDFWNKRMREIHNEQLASRKEDIRKRLELPEDKPPEIKHWSSSTTTTTTTTSSSSSSRKTEKIVKPIETTKRSKIHIESDDDDVEYVGTKTIKPERIERIERLPPPPPTDRQDRFDYERHPRDDPREYYSYTRTRPPSYRNYYQRGGGGGGGNMSRPPPQSSSRHYSHQYTIKEKSPSPILNEDNILKEDLEIVGLLRLLTALEGQLGSLGPKVVTLLSRALAAEKVKPNSAEELLDDEDVNVLFETVKEKLKGQLFAGMIEKMAIAPTKSAIQNIAQLLHKATEDKKKKQQLKEEEEKRQKQAEMAKSLAAFAARTTIPYSRTIDLPPIRSEPVSVPGIGSVDKIAIAQQIAAALLAQGRDNVSQDELETLINAVVGMAEASKHSDKPITAASFVKSLTDNNNEQVHETSNNTIIEQPKLSPLPPPPQQQQIVPTPAVVVAQPVIPLISPPIIAKQREPTPPPPPQKIIDPIEAHAARMENLTDNDLKDLLQNFKDLGTDEQHGLINFLKKLEASDPERVEKLRGFVNLGGGNNSTTSNNNKRRSISPQSDVEYISTKSRQSVSPFSTRKGGHNPSDDEHSKWKPKLDMFADEEEEEEERRQQQQRKQLQQQQQQQQQQQTKQQLNKNRYDDDKKRARIELSDDDDDDDDYSFEDIYKAANKNVVDSEKAKSKRISRSKSFSRSWSRSRSRSISPPKNNSNNNNNNKRNDDSMGMLSETNRLIETLMVNLPNKYVIKSHNNTSKPTSNISRNNDVPPPGSTIVSMPPPPFQNPPSYQNQNIQLTQPPPPLQQQQQQQDVTYPGPLGQHQFAAYQQQNSQQFNSNSNYMNMGLNNGYGNYNQNNYNQGLNTNQQYLQPPPNYVPTPQMFSGNNNNQYGGQQGQLTQGPPSGPPPVGYPQQTQYPNYSQQQQQQQQRFY